MATNVEFLTRIVDHKSFREADLTTSFIEEHQQELLSPSAISPELLGLTTSIQRLLIQKRGSKMDTSSPWSALGYKRLNHDHHQSLHFNTIEGVEYNVHLISTNDGTFITEDDKTKQKITISELLLKDGNFHAEVQQSGISIFQF